MSKKDTQVHSALQGRLIAHTVAESHNVTDPKIIALIQLGVIAGLKAEPLVCTCLSALEDDAYDPGGPMSGHRRPPPCQVHSAEV